MAYLDRPEWHSCASLVGWDLNHPRSKDFFQSYANLIRSGAIFLLPQWHDSYVLDYLRAQLQVPVVDMAADIPRNKLKGWANVFDEVVPFARHYKGSLKQNIKRK